MASDLVAPPVLSTPTGFGADADTSVEAARLGPGTTADLDRVYEVSRTAAHMRQRGWRRVALQFPDAMLPDAGRVVQRLGTILSGDGVVAGEGPRRPEPAVDVTVADADADADAASPRSEKARDGPALPADPYRAPRFYVLADTSYSACCVDDIAAEHVDADAVVHYGRACLSPTARLPVLHIFTRQELDHDAVTEAFVAGFPDKRLKVVVMADVMFQEHVESVCVKFRARGYEAVVATEVVRDPLAVIPNRRLLKTGAVEGEAEAEADLKDHHLFHVGTPATSLLLTLSSRLASLRIYASPDTGYSKAADVPDASNAPALLRRRYGLVLRLATASIIGILINTLSVQNYLSTISTVRKQIAEAGKKSYTIVVGKLNAAKLANFAEVDGWVVVGCWESSLVEQDGLWKPVVTPFELALALKSDEERVWDGSWWGGIEAVQSDTADPSGTRVADKTDEAAGEVAGEIAEEPMQELQGGISDDESEPPQFDLRTGRLVSNSRPMRLAIRNNTRRASVAAASDAASAPASSSALVCRRDGQLATVNGVLSPGAEYLASQRTWRGLGTEFEAGDAADADEDVDGVNGASTLVQEGRSGVARGYTVGHDGARA